MPAGLIGVLWVQTSRPLEFCTQTPGIPTPNATTTNTPCFPSISPQVCVSGVDFHHFYAPKRGDDEQYSQLYAQTTRLLQPNEHPCPTVKSGQLAQPPRIPTPNAHSPSISPEVDSTAVDFHHFAQASNNHRQHPLFPQHFSKGVCRVPLIALTIRANNTPAAAKKG